MKAHVIWNNDKNVYQLILRNKVICSSKSSETLEGYVVKQKHPKILKHKITEVETIFTKPVKGGINISDENGNDIASVAPSFNIEERFEFLEELIYLVIEGDAKSLVISGEGGVGKTYTVMDVLAKAGKINCNTIEPNISDLDIVIEDTEKKIKEKIHAQINKPKGDFVVIKGHSSPKALYRMLFENRNRTIVFDDCDSVLRDSTAINLLKSALDSYEDRWVSWFIEQPFGESDLPLTFKFNGKIIFISNMKLHKIDEAVKTRCFKVDLSMTKQQRIERMRSVLDDVMPHIDREHKVEALDLLEEHMHVTNDINFRTLMNMTTIRVSNSPNWKKLAIYSLTEE
jgi:hypothetical protein